MVEVQENKPFRINFKNGDQTIYMVKDRFLKDIAEMILVGEICAQRKCIIALGLT